MQIREDDLTGEAVANLLQEHLDEMYEITPVKSVHTLGIEELSVPEITFWTAWEGEVLVGCGALKEIDTANGEIKSMRTAKAHRGKGVGSKILSFLVEQARLRSYETLYLETGAMPEFEPARAMYMKCGFAQCDPFADYKEDDNSVYMSMKL